MEDQEQAQLAEFVAENRQALYEVEQGLLALEQDPAQSQRLQDIFRYMHTVKGNCRLLGFVGLEGVTHTAEELLAALRDGSQQLSPGALELLLQVVAQVRQEMGRLRRSGDESGLDKAALSRLQQQLTAFATTGTAAEPGPGNSDAAAAGPEINAGDSGLEEGFVRLPVERLDGLLDGLSEVANGVGYWQQQASSSALQQGLEEVATLLQQLQDKVLGYRLEPIGRIWQPYPRLLRDLAQATGKRVKLQTDGEDTEVDRSVLLAIKEPLLHLVRNAVDHGIEPPQQRQQAGKPVVATLRLKAWQEQGQVLVEVADDGQGLDPHKLAQRARELGVLAADADSQQVDWQQLIFTPGFSTAAQVSAISGRGTGLDAVKAAVERVGGQLQVESEPQKGSCFCLRIPQTMAMVTSLVVEVGQLPYALPQAQLVEVLALKEEARQQAQQSHLGQPVLAYRGQQLPFISLPHLLAEPGAKAALPAASEAKLLHVVVVRQGACLLALQVEGVADITSLVVKPLPAGLRQVPVLAGVALLPGGKPVFMLDIPALVQEGLHQPQA